MACLSHDPVLGHISTFGGSPLACAVSLATLSVIKEEQLHIQALEKGVYLAKQLAHPAFVEVRQCGLMLALQLRTKQAAQRLLQAALAEGLLIDTFLFCESALRVAPPLIITRADMDTVQPARVVVRLVLYAIAGLTSTHIAVPPQRPDVLAVWLGIHPFQGPEYAIVPLLSRKA